MSVIVPITLTSTPGPLGLLAELKLAYLPGYTEGLRALIHVSIGT